MNRKIRLSDNHTRSLSSSLIVVEKSLLELEELMLSQKSGCCNKVMLDVDNDLIAGNIETVKEAKKHICLMAEKYGTTKETQSLQRIINAKRTKIWEILTDTLSAKAKGYGTFPKRYADEYDADIRKLIEIAGKINY